MHRRSFLKMGVGLGVLFSTSALSKSPTSRLRRFIKLSQELTGHSSLDPDLAKRYLTALIERHGVERVQQLLSKPFPISQASQALTNEIVADWYSGVTLYQGEKICVDYTGALVWSALTFTKPRSICGGAVGYWSVAPEELGVNG